jgi:hypothetical protein
MSLYGCVRNITWAGVGRTGSACAEMGQCDEGSEAVQPALPSDSGATGQYDCASSFTLPRKVQYTMPVYVSTNGMPIPAIRRPMPKVFSLDAAL